MSATKRQIAADAFSELALHGFEFDITPEELEQAVRRLDQMAAAWEADGIRLGYDAASDDPDTPSGLPDGALDAAVASLAVRIASGWGKQAAPDTRRIAREGYARLLRQAAMPAAGAAAPALTGAGNRMRRQFFPAAAAPVLDLTQGGDLQISND